MNGKIIIPTDFNDVDEEVANAGAISTERKNIKEETQKISVFDSFIEGWNQGKKRAYDKSYRRRDKNNIPVKLVQPGSDRTIELVVTDKNEFMSKLYMDQLRDYAMTMERCGASWSATENSVKITFADDEMANIERQRWST